MPQLLSWYGREFVLPDDPNSAAIAIQNVNNNCTPTSTDAQIITQIQNQDSTVAPIGTVGTNSDSGGGSDGDNTDEGIILG